MEILTKKSLTRKDAKFIVNNVTEVKEALLTVESVKINRTWNALLGKKRLQVLDYFSKGLWIEDSEGDYCTAWTQTIQVCYFVKTKVCVPTSIRVKVKATHSEKLQGGVLFDAIEDCGIIGLAATEVRNKAKGLMGAKYKWISADQYLSSDKKGWISVLGAELC